MTVAEIKRTDIRPRAEELPLETVKTAVTRLVQNSDRRISTRDVLCRLRRDDKTASRTARRAITSLVTDGTLRYVNDSGVSFLETNYAGRVRVSENVWVLPPRVNGGSQKKNVVTVRIAPGAAFGDCRHPTTRLSVRAIDVLLTGDMLSAFPASGLDIGTGSGVLAITAARLGVHRITATDVDPCARSEARKNIMENGLADRISVSDSPLSMIPSPIALVTANLRLPTLKAMAPDVGNMVTSDGAAVISGVEEQEASQLLAVYQKQFACAWQASEGGWTALILMRKDDTRT
ncbi:MAG: 50S ribosomal protein L11 methyltransferase [Thermodesulfobacteriota bacterium]|nr:50S ribosomal protein L11 methyltransferase [Thermodesulfobacteriota bacterium]